LNNDVDERSISPADYTVMIKNIPRNLNVNYYDEMRNILQNYTVPGEQLLVTKIVLVYDVEEIFHNEHTIKQRIVDI
jgi:hypothetical protein